MQMINRVPEWVTPVAWLYIALSLAAAAWIALDIFGGGRRHASVANELVWVASGLYLGPFAVPLYRHRGRTPRTGPRQRAAVEETSSPAVAGLPGGGASALAHLIGVPLVLLSGLTIAGIDLWVMIIVIGLIAMLLLFSYERTTARSGAGGVDAGGAGKPRRRGASVRGAAIAAVVTVLAFDIGMGGWMLLLHFNEYMPPATEGSFWFLMQLGIILGLATGYPAVRWLQQSRPGA